jgi:hypothetical protein
MLQGHVSNSDTLTGDLLFTVPLAGAVYKGATTSLAQHTLVNYAAIGARDGT